MTCENRLKTIIKNWFISEPLLFSIITTHHLVMNDGLSVAMRTGRMCIEFSNLLCSELSDTELTDFLKIETYRILLKHPMPVSHTRQIQQHFSLQVMLLLQNILSLPAALKVQV